MPVPDLRRFTGLGQFGPAYRIMLENDSHAPGSVDRVLSERMIRLCPETAAYLYTDYTPTTVHYGPGSRPLLERTLAEITGEAASAEARIDAIVRRLAEIATRDDKSLDELRLGGTEEEILQRGTDWCTDLARVGCALCQILGMPARLLLLFRVNAAYSGHEIIEVHRSGGWGAADVVYGVVYRHPDGRPASSWDLLRDPDLIAAHWPDPHQRRGKVEQFLGVALVNYFIWEAGRYDYAISTLTDYCRSILELSVRGWPGGLRWLHGEDRADPRYSPSHP